jgi:hypothetical protein
VSEDNGEEVELAVRAKAYKEKGLALRQVITWGGAAAGARRMGGDEEEEVEEALSLDLGGEEEFTEFHTQWSIIIGQ